MTDQLLNQTDLRGENILSDWCHQCFYWQLNALFITLYIWAFLY